MPALSRERTILLGRLGLTFKGPITSGPHGTDSISQHFSLSGATVPMIEEAIDSIPYANEHTHVVLAWPSGGPNDFWIRVPDGVPDSEIYDVLERIATVTQERRSVVSVAP